MFFHENSQCIQADSLLEVLWLKNIVSGWSKAQEHHNSQGVIQDKIWIVWE